MHRTGALLEDSFPQVRVGCRVSSGGEAVRHQIVCRGTGPVQSGRPSLIPHPGSEGRIEAWMEGAVVMSLEEGGGANLESERSYCRHSEHEVFGELSDVVQRG